MSVSDIIFWYFWIFGFVFGLNFAILIIKTEEDLVFAAWVLIIAISGFGLALIALIEYYKEQYRELNKIRRR